MFKHLLVPLDGSAIAESAIDTAVLVAQGCAAEIGLVMAHRPQREGLLDATVNYTVDPAQRAHLRKLAEDVAGHAHVATNACVEVGEPADVIFRRARELGSDLIVMTTRGRTGLRRTFLGSVAQEVLRLSSLPVLMLRPSADEPAQRTPAKPFRRVLVPLDGSEVAATVLPFAADLAKCGDGTVVLLRVVKPLPFIVATAEMPPYSPAVMDPELTRDLAASAQEALDALATRVGGEHGVTVESLVTTAASPADSILATAEAQSADAIAMTPVARGASRLILGSVSDGVLRRGRLPLLLYRPSAEA